MSRRRSLLPTLAIAIAGVFAVSFLAYGQLGGTQGVRIPYRGYVEQGGNAFTADVQMKFTVHDELPNSAACYTSPAIPVSVVEGNFIAVIGPVTEACVIKKRVFIAAQIDGGGGFVQLAGRQEVFPAVGAMTAGAGDFAIGLATYTTNQEGGIELGATGTSPFIDFHGQGGGAGADYNVRLIHDATNRLRVAGTMQIDGDANVSGNASVGGSLSFGSATRQMVNLWATEYGIGVQNSTTYFRTGNSFAWHRGGSHNDGYLDPGGGTRLAHIDSAGNMGVAGSLSTTGVAMSAQKVCRGVNGGQWTVSTVVPQTWSAENCRNWVASENGSPLYYLECMQANGFSIGSGGASGSANSAGAPNPNCGW